MLEFFVFTVAGAFVVLTGAAAAGCFKGCWGCQMMPEDGDGEAAATELSVFSSSQAAAAAAAGNEETLYVTLLRHADTDNMVPYNTFKLIDQVFSHRTWYDDVDLESVAFAYPYLCFKRSCIATVERQMAISHIVLDNQYAGCLARTFMLEGLSRAARHVYETQKSTTMQDALVAVQYVCSFERVHSFGLIHPYISQEEIIGLFERSKKTRPWLFRMSKYSSSDLAIPNMTLLTLSKADFATVSVSHVRFVHVHGIGFYALYSPVAAAVSSFKNLLEARRTNSRKPLAVTFVDLVLYVCKKYLLTPDGYVAPPPLSASC